MYVAKLVKFDFDNMSSQIKLSFGKGEMFLSE